MKTLKQIFIFLGIFAFSSCDNYNETILSAKKEQQRAKDVTSQDGANARPANVPALQDINAWLTQHASVASRIRWQFQPGTHPTYGSYYVMDADKISWTNWTAAQKADLVTAYNSTYQWYYYNYANGVDAVPVIQQSVEAFSANGASRIYITGTSAWNLYIRWMAHSLFIETYHIVPWSVTYYDTESLDLLFDSSRFMRMVGNGNFILGFDQGNHGYQPERKNLIGQTTISAPIFTYKFLKSTGILPTWDLFVPPNGKKTVIKNLINWSSQNMTHFYGADSQQNSMDHWGEQAPAFAKVVNGTTAPYFPYFSHWTAGCGGTSSFFAHALRAANIPVQYVAVCDHYLPVFRTEAVFMDHGDNPYNSNYTSSGLTADVLLQNSAMFNTLFGQDYYSTFNVLNGVSNDPACDNVAYTVKNLFQ